MIHAIVDYDGCMPSCSICRSYNIYADTTTTCSDRIINNNILFDLSAEVILLHNGSTLAELISANVVALVTDVEPTNGQPPAV